MDRRHDDEEEKVATQRSATGVLAEVYRTREGRPMGTVNTRLQRRVNGGSRGAAVDVISTAF